MDLPLGECESKFWHLKKCPLFNQLSDEEMHALKDAGKRIDIFRLNYELPLDERDDSLFIVKMGSGRKGIDPVPRPRRCLSSRAGGSLRSPARAIPDRHPDLHSPDPKRGFRPFHSAIPQPRLHAHQSFSLSSEETRGPTGGDSPPPTRGAARKGLGRALLKLW